MKIRDAIDRARKDIGVSTDDTSISNRFVYSHLKSVRAELLRQEVEKKGLWTNFPLQTLQRFLFKEIDQSLTEDYSTGKTVLRSVLPFPTVMDIKDGKVIGTISLPTGERIDLTTYNGFLNSNDRRYQSSRAKFYIRDKYGYIVNYPSVPELVVDIDALYEDPEEVEKLNEADKCEGGCVFYPDLEFNLPSYLEGRFFRIVSEGLMQSLRIPKDRTNNGTEDFAVLQPQNQTQRNNE